MAQFLLEVDFHPDIALQVFRFLNALLESPETSGMEVEELYFPDEGHGFAKEENRLLYYEQMAKFFDKHLK